MVRGFGSCELDYSSRQLRRQNEIVHLSPKAFELLKLLVERAPNAVAKEEIHAAIWPGTFVSDGSLTNVVAEIRAAIGDKAGKSSMVRTVHGFGYAFAADVRETRRDGREIACRLVLGNRRFTLTAGRNLIGRDAGAEVLIDHTSVSRKHASVVVSGDAVVLHDLQSRNGTFVNGRRIDGPTELLDGDVVGLGPVTLMVEKLSKTGTTKADLIR